MTPPKDFVDYTRVSLSVKAQGNRDFDLEPIAIFLWGAIHPRP